MDDDASHADREMLVEDVMRSSVSNACRWLEIDEDEYWVRVRSSIVRATMFLRSPTDATSIRIPAAASARIAQLLEESGIDPQTAALPRYHEEGAAELFGVVVTPDRSAYAFDFRWGEDNCPPPEAGIFTGWEILTDNWEQSIYVEDVFRGFKALDDRWLDNPSQSE